MGEREKQGERERSELEEIRNKGRLLLITMSGGVGRGNRRTLDNLF